MLPFELTKDTPYLALSGELWSVFYEYFNRNWSCYKGFLLYMYCAVLHDIIIIIVLRWVDISHFSHVLTFQSDFPIFFLIIGFEQTEEVNGLLVNYGISQHNYVRDTIVYH